MTKTKKKYKNTGGKVIASGGYGCVFDPALKCEGASNRESNKITKLMTEKHAVQEYEEINKIKNKLDSIKNYSDYFLINNSTLCRPAKLSSSDLAAFSDKCTALPKDNITKANINSKLEDVMSLNLPNGGLPVDDYIYANGSYEKLYKTHKTLTDLLKKGIIPMNKRNIYHSDIKDSNVLIDDKGKARLIDWGLTVEYKPNENEKFPRNWRNRPLQFNVPFSVVVFTDTFYEKYSNYLKDGGKVEAPMLRPFVIDYLNEWIKERGSGHYKFINEIMFLLYNSSLNSISESSKPGIIETEISMPYIIDYIIDVLVHFTKFKNDGSLNLREYLNDVYIKIVDIWGFIMVYYPLVEMLSSNYAKLNAIELKMFNQIKYIFNEYLYTPRHVPININELFTELDNLGELLYAAAYNEGHLANGANKRNRTSKSTSNKTSNKTSKSTSNKTSKKVKTSNNNKNKILNSSSIFKRKKLVKRFKKSFFLSLK